ncbi:MAG: asparagine synthase (glutamine-hydrolyzing) [Magnetospirillum sp.]|nr:asparagine synthase (glutamine-hydrolyzing) [Magnetospirillum sp.]
MSGLAGFLDIDVNTPDRETVATRMAAAVAHRGPDDARVWVDDAAGLAFGFRRLALLEPSPSGRQPMESRDGRWVLALDGAIFNHHELRRRLDPIAWRGHSDAEVFLEAISRWGLERALAAADGMFALALWDRSDRALSLARDRIGEKPLAYAAVGGRILFGSEVRALAAHPAWDATLDRDALALYMRQGWIPAPHTIYRAARKVMPATIVTFAGGRRSERVTWSAPDRAAAIAGRFSGGPEAAAERLNQHLRSAVTLRMDADVPVGAMLSGGVDSALMTAVMQEMAAGSIPTVGLAIPGCDDGVRAATVAAALGTRHTQIEIGEREALATVRRLALLCDEPFADPLQLPACLLAETARREMGVALVSAGADALFAGAGIHRSIPQAWARLSRWPRWIRRAAAGIADGLPSAALGHRHRRALQSFSASGIGDLHRQHYSRWQGPGSPVLGASRAAASFGDIPEAVDPALAVMLLDTTTMLPDDVCVALDRAAGAAGLEARLPFLDQAVIEFAWTLPTAFHIAGETGKAMLGHLLRRYLPPALCEMPGAPCTAPLGRWLNGGLKEWADDLLAEDRLKRDGILDAAVVTRCWREHRAGTHDRQTELWHALMFLGWLDGTRR